MKKFIVFLIVFLLVFSLFLSVVALANTDDLKITITGETRNQDGSVNLSFVVYNSGATLSGVAFCVDSPVGSVDIARSYAAALDASNASISTIEAGRSYSGSATAFFNTGSVECLIIQAKVAAEIVGKSVVYYPEVMQSGNISYGSSGTSTSPLGLNSSVSVPSGNPGNIVSIVLPLVFNTNAGWDRVTDVTIIPQVSEDVDKWPFEIEKISYARNLNLYSLKSTNISYSLKISQKATAGIKALKFDVEYTAVKDNENEVIKTTFTTYVNVLSDGSEGSGGALVLSAVDASGKSVEVPKGNAGGKVNMTLALQNNGGNLSNIEITPNISTSLEEFPFLVEKQSYKQTISSLASSSIATVKYNFTISPNATVGTKVVTFTAKYLENGVQKQNKLTAYINILKGSSGTGSGSTPKLIISSYNISPDKVYAGNVFTLDLTFRNTSATDDINNLTVSIANVDTTGSYIMPAKNGSNTIYISTIPADSSVKRSVELQVRPDAPAKPNMLALSLQYENGAGSAFTSSENITVPISQKMRVVISEPSIYTEMLNPGSSVYVSFPILNMGKSSIYNLMVEAEGQGFHMEESNYIGTLAAGSQASADFNIIMEQVGELSGNIVVIYEDEYGEEIRELLPVNFSVTEYSEPAMGENQSTGEVPAASAGLPLGVKIPIAVVVVAAIVTAIILLRKRAIKKRGKELEEE